MNKPIYIVEDDISKKVLFASFDKQDIDDFSNEMIDNFASENIQFCQTESFSDDIYSDIYTIGFYKFHKDKCPSIITDILIIKELTNY